MHSFAKNKDFMIFIRKFDCREVKLNVLGNLRSYLLMNSVIGNIVKTLAK